MNANAGGMYPLNNSYSGRQHHCNHCCRTNNAHQRGALGLLEHTQLRPQTANLLPSLVAVTELVAPSSLHLHSHAKPGIHDARTSLESLICSHWHTVRTHSDAHPVLLLLKSPESHALLLKSPVLLLLLLGKLPPLPDGYAFLVSCR